LSLKPLFLLPPNNIDNMDASDQRISTLFVIPLIQWILGAILLIALLNNQRDLTILTLVTLGLVFGTRLWARWSIARIACTSTIDKQKVFPGEALSLEIKTENNKILPVWFEVEFSATGLLPPSSRERTLSRGRGLLGHQRASFRWAFTAQRRGFFRIGPIVLRVGDLLGFYPRAKAIDRDLSVLVYPRLVPIRSFPVPRRDFFGIPGAKSPVQDPVYILGTRDYQPGHPAKHIHWKASARRYRVQEKVFEPTEQEKILLALDVKPFAAHGATEDFERTLEVVASLAVRLDQKGCAMGFVTNGTMPGENAALLPVSRNVQQIPSLLERLARIQMQAREDLLAMIRRGLGIPWGISCIYFSWEEDATTLAAREFFQFRNSPVVFLVCRSSLGGGEGGTASGSRVYRLEDLLMKECPTP
jgi:uncharacterized protein (DUF58 family)